MESNAAPSSTGDVRKSISDRKIAANRENAKKSTGPKTDAGKTRSSQNAYKHGFFAEPLYPTDEQVRQDRSDFDDIIDGLLDHYEPVDYIENMLVEKIAAAYVRSARLLRHEQRLFEFRHPFEFRSASSLPRCQTTIERQLAKDIGRLEGLQEQRKAQSASGEAEVEPTAEAGVELSPAATVDLTTTLPAGLQTETNPRPSPQNESQANVDELPPTSGDESVETKPPSSLANTEGNAMV